MRSEYVLSSVVFENDEHELSNGAKDSTQDIDTNNDNIGHSSHHGNGNNDTYGNYNGHGHR